MKQNEMQKRNPRAGMSLKTSRRIGNTVVVSE